MPDAYVSKEREPSMSEICPCGSGLALEKCCVSKEIAGIKQGSLNHGERREWAESYITYKTVINEQIIEEQERYIRSLGRAITCKAGCSMCCVEFIAARLEECDAIAMYLYTRPELMNRFLLNYKTWLDRITFGKNILLKASEAYQKLFETREPDDKKAFEVLALDYAKAYTPCPFLENDQCMIYPIRPFVCSIYGVVSDKKYCDPKWHIEAREQKRKIKSAIHPLHFENSYFVDLKGRLIFGPMPHMVYGILSSGPKMMT